MIIVLMVIIITSIVSIISHHDCYNLFSTIFSTSFRQVVPLHSAKGGAVETGCSDLYDAMYQFAI